MPITLSATYDSVISHATRLLRSVPPSVIDCQPASPAMEAACVKNTSADFFLTVVSTKQTNAAIEAISVEFCHISFYMIVYVLDDSTSLFQVPRKKLSAASAADLEEPFQRLTQSFD